MYQDFHDELITDRLSSTGIMNFYSDSGPGVTITDWNVLNEPLHVTHYSDTFETAGIYTSNIEAWADYFIRARAIRPVKQSTPWMLDRNVPMELMDRQLARKSLGTASGADQAQARCDEHDLDGGATRAQR